MVACIAAEKIIIPTQPQDYDMEARVLSDWLRKGHYFYRSETGEELSVVGRLFKLLPKIQDKTLKGEVEAVLKQSVVESM